MPADEDERAGKTLVRYPLRGGGHLVYDPDVYGGAYALATELSEGFEDIGDYWRITTRERTT